ncbi:MAG: helix-turn-helix domain-containing protein [Acidobacteriota bacterium]
MKEQRARSVSTITRGFGFRLRRARKECGLSQQQLADMVDANVMQISKYERGQVLPAFETAVALAEVLRISADALLMGREQDKAPTAPGINDLRLYERFLEAERLSRQSREAIILLIDGVIAKHKMEEVLQGG